MHWTDTAIVLSARKHGETSAVARIFARGHGVYAGIVRGAHSKANRGVIQPGNIVSATWQARLSEHLGSFKCELLEANAAQLMQDAARLAALTSACTVLEASLPERHPYVRLYGIFQKFLTVIASDHRERGNPEDATTGWIAASALPPRNDGNWPEEYVRLELELLAEAGFGLDLSQCAATGTTEDLIYVSPKSGRAVSRQAGEPYKEKLLALPQFLLCSPLGGEQARASAKHEDRAVRGSPPQKEGSLREHSRQLRKESTPAEKKLWHHLCNRRLEGYKFRRQHPMGNQYIADFICLEKKLIIELDGSQHAEQQNYDAKRTVFLEQEGYRVLRFWNNEVMENSEGVWERIAEALRKTPHASDGALRTGLSSAALPQGESKEKNEEILAGLQLTGYFLDHWLLTPHKRKLPAARGRLIEMMKEYYGAEA